MLTNQSTKFLFTLPKHYLLLLSLFILPTGQLFGADHFVPPDTSTVDCITYNGGIKAGDTITLAGGYRGPLTIRNCTGTSGQKVTVRNDPTSDKPTVLRRGSASSGGFIFTCRDCQEVVIDGTGKWAGADGGAYCGAPNGRTGCGIKLTSIVADDAPSAYLMIMGFSTKVTVRGVEIHGRASNLATRGGVGIQQNDHSITRAENPNFWREGMVYEKNYIHDVYGEGMYIGPNWTDGGVPLRNITIRENLIEDTGRQNIQLKSAIGGTNLIHHNVVRRSGLRGEAHQGGGIDTFEGGSDTKIFNNWVEASGREGIHQYNMRIPGTFGPFRSEIFNNIVVDAGKQGGRDFRGHGIGVGYLEGAAAISSTVYNNTVVKTALAGIIFNNNVSNSEARDNIVANAGTVALSLGNNRNVNNVSGDVSFMKFADPGNLVFDLSADSPARNAGTAAGAPQSDYRGTPRPQGGMPDQGAFEFRTTETVAQPDAPGAVVID